MNLKSKTWQKSSPFKKIYENAKFKKTLRNRNIRISANPNPDRQIWTVTDIKIRENNLYQMDSETNNKL